MIVDLPMQPGAVAITGDCGVNANQMFTWRGRDTGRKCIAGGAVLASEFLSVVTATTVDAGDGQHWHTRSRAVFVCELKPSHAATPAELKLDGRDY